MLLPRCTTANRYPACRIPIPILARSLNWVRKPRFGNLLQSWSIAAANDGKAFKDFPELKPEDEMEKHVEWWNARIAERASGGQSGRESAPKIVAGAQMDILLNKKTGWLGF